MGRIVFVVGAGASNEFDSFPVGDELARRIDTQLAKEVRDRDGPISGALMANGGLTEDHRRAMTRISRGIHSVDSIDKFIDECRDEKLVATIAKLAIAREILSAEDTCSLRVDDGIPLETTLRTARATWLGLICRYANESVSRQDFLQCLRGIAFVTFNYDRSIERFLTLWAQGTLLVAYEEAAKLVSSIPIKHVFGTMGHLPGLPTAGEPQTIFGEVNASSIWRAARGIKTFTEEIGSDHMFEIRRLVSDADRIVFLGFHFHRPNMDILFEGGWPRDRQVYATTYKMSARARGRVETGFGSFGNRFTPVSDKCGPFMGQFGEEILDFQ